MTNDIISSYGLKQEDILTCTSSTKAGILHITIKLTNRGTRCHNCGTFTKLVKDYIQKDITNSIFIYKPCIIHYFARRLKCPNCGSTTLENNPFTSDYRTISNATVLSILRLIKDYNQTFSSVARMVNLSTTKVIEIFDNHVQPHRKHLSSSICIDEFYFSRSARKKYALLILDFTHGNIIDMLETREKHRLSSYFHSIPIEERRIANYVSIDMNDIYRRLIPVFFTNALVCADSFHVIKNINDSLDIVRKRILRRYENNTKSDEYYLLKYQKNLLYREIEVADFSKIKKNHHFKYRVSDQEKLEMMLKIDEQLRISYFLKESYSVFNSNDFSAADRENLLSDLIERFLDSGIEEMVSVGNTLLNWKKEILNSFSEDIKYKKINGVKVPIKYRVSNGPIEGRNKYIKILLKLANGYSNFERFRNRCMYVLNKYESFSSEIIPHKVRKKGVPRKKKTI